MNPVVIVSACRTPIGAFNGALSELSATALGSIAIENALQRISLSPKQVDTVIMGLVLSAGVGQAPARQAALGAGLSEKTPCVTLNKVCGSGLKAIACGVDSIRLGRASCVVVGGMESMSRSPYLLPHARKGYRLGNSELIDSMIHDGLFDPYHQVHMGLAGERCAEQYGFSRDQQDTFAIQSYERALAAQKKGYFKDELCSITLKKDTIIEDESPTNVQFDKLPHLKPIFKKNGTITAANASSINDGAAALILMSLEHATRLNIEPLAVINDYAEVAGPPEWFTTAPKASIEQLLQAQSISENEVDLFEINEAFSVVNLYCETAGKIPRSKTNIHGGAIALGHPIGASGARILVTLLYALKQHALKRGVASLCIGGGEAISMLIDTSI